MRLATQSPTSMASSGLHPPADVCAGHGRASSNCTPCIDTVEILQTARLATLLEAAAENAVEGGVEGDGEGETVVEGT